MFPRPAIDFQVTDYRRGWSAQPYTPPHFNLDPSRFRALDEVTFSLRPIDGIQNFTGPVAPLGKRGMGNMRDPQGITQLLIQWSRPKSNRSLAGFALFGTQGLSALAAVPGQAIP
jgi:hypothetical protein